MAHTLDAIMPKILAQGLMTLRENAVMPRLVNGSYSVLAAQKSQTIDIPLPASMKVQDVTPAAHAGSATANDSLTPTTAKVVMDQWKEVPFYLSDKDMMDVENNIVPMQLTEAVKVLANTVDDYLFDTTANVFNFVGTPGVTPFATDIRALQDARKFLADWGTPPDNRRFVFDSAAEANMLGLPQYTNASFTGDATALNTGNIFQKLGFDHFMDQNVTTHSTNGTTAALTGLTVGANAAAGATQITIASASTAATLTKGDILEFAGVDQTYVVSSAATIAGGGSKAISVGPNVQAALASATAVDVKASHVKNLVFHRDAIAFANRPIASENVEGLGRFMTMQDRVSGLVMRLEVTREYKRTRWAFDMLYGATCVRPEMAARIAG